jgi:glycosyltransferase involved in cell wall biosynthesis
MRPIKTLFVTKNSPQPPFAGSTQRTAILIDVLSTFGKVDLLILGQPEMKPFLESKGYSVVDTYQPLDTKISLFSSVIGKRGAQGLRFLAGPDAAYQHDPALLQRLKALVSNRSYDLVVGRYFAPSAKAGLFDLNGTPCVIDVDDADSRVLSSRIMSPATNSLLSHFLKTRLNAVERWERELLPKASMLWLTNPADSNLTATSKSAVISNIPFTIPQRGTLENSKPDSSIVLWVGSFNHRVNLDGVDHFLDKTWPQILARNGAIRFRVVGSHLPEKMRQKWSRYRNVDVVGHADSLEPHYAEAALSIVPLMDGAGTKIKILESLAHLRTCVATAHSATGYEGLLNDGESIRVAKNLDDLVEPVCELVADHGKRHRLENTGRDVVEAHFTREAIRISMADSLRSIIPE